MSGGESEPRTGPRPFRILRHGQAWKACLDGAAAEVERLGETSREEHLEKMDRITVSNAAKNLNNVSKNYPVQPGKRSSLIRTVLLQAGG